MLSNSKYPATRRQDSAFTKLLQVQDYNQLKIPIHASLILKELLDFIRKRVMTSLTRDKFTITARSDEKQ